MPLRTLVKLCVFLWIVAEVLVFAGVAHVVGSGWALLAAIATTLIGGSLLRRVGTAAMMRLRGTLQGRDDGRVDDVLDGTLGALSAALLLLPGFLSDAAGVALAIPPVRAHASRWIRRGGLGVRFQTNAPRTIDLDRDEWSRTRPGGDGRLR